MDGDRKDLDENLTTVAQASGAPCAHDSWMEWRGGEIGRDVSDRCGEVLWLVWHGARARAHGHGRFMILRDGATSTELHDYITGR